MKKNLLSFIVMAVLTSTMMVLKSLLSKIYDTKVLCRILENKSQ